MRPPAPRTAWHATPPFETKSDCPFAGLPKPACAAAGRSAAASAAIARGAAARSGLATGHLHRLGEVALDPLRDLGDRLLAPLADLPDRHDREELREDGVEEDEAGDERRE